LSEVMILIIQMVAAGRMCPTDDGLNGLARNLIELGRLRAPEFSAVVRHLVVGARSRQLARLHTFIEGDSQFPDFWRRAAQRYAAECLARISAADFYCPIEFIRAGYSLDDGFRACQRFLHQFGTLMTIWPKVWQLAKSAGADDLIGRCAEKSGVTSGAGHNGRARA
jgi:hypothetical protein